MWIWAVTTLLQHVAARIQYVAAGQKLKVKTREFHRVLLYARPV